MPEGRWYVIGSILLLMLLSFLAGWFCARHSSPTSMSGKRQIESIENM
jgi:hypothetical protein